LTAPIDLYTKKYTMLVNGDRELIWLPRFFQISSFVFSRGEKKSYWFRRTWEWV